MSKFHWIYRIPSPLKTPLWWVYGGTKFPSIPSAAGKWLDEGQKSLRKTGGLREEVPVKAVKEHMRDEGIETR